MWGGLQTHAFACVNVHTCINSFRSPGCLLVGAPPLNTRVGVEAEGCYGQTTAGGWG